MAKRTRQQIDGTRLLYHFLQKELHERDIWLFQMFTTRLVVALGIWLHPSIYRDLPLLVPYAVRDPQSRGNKKLKIPDSWGSPNAQGYFRDDNSLLKGVPRSLHVASRSSLYAGRRIGPGFVAAHVWQRFTNGDRAARHPLTYSFVPNLVWLPCQFAALTDQHESFVQTYVQALAYKIYREEDVRAPLRPVVEQAWNLLPAPTGVPKQGLPTMDELNFFEPTEAWRRVRLQKIREVAEALAAVVEARPMPQKVIAERYTAGLNDVGSSEAAALKEHLEAFLSEA
jgi:hypothetical protein